MKILLVALVFTLNCSGYAQTAYSKTIKEIQRKYADSYSKVPILIFDQDEIEFLYAKASAYGDTKEKELERSTIIQQYVLDHIGVTLTVNQAQSIAVYTTALKGVASGVPIPDYSSARKYSMCAVFPASANSNKRLETERILGLGTQGAYLNRHYSEIKEKLSYDELRFFSLFHELAHCLDETFLPQALSHEPDAHAIHEAESFAETLGLMMLERYGIVGTADRRAHYRNLYSLEMGRWLAGMEPTFGMDSLTKKWGAIYYLTPSLLAAKIFLKKNRSFVVEATLQDLAQKALEIVTAHTLSSRLFASIVAWLEKGDVATQNYVELSYQHPDLFADTLDQLLGYQTRSQYMLEKTWNLGFKVAPVSFNLSIDDETLCRHFQAGDRDALDRQVDELRRALSESNEYARIEDLKKNQIRLNDLYFHLSQTCSNIQ